MGIHPDLTAYRAVDACGGSQKTPRNDYDSGYAAGYEAALDAAIEAVKKPDALMGELLAALKAMDEALCDGFDTQAARMANRKALIAARAAISKAEGRNP